MSLFNNSSKQLRRIIEQSISMLKVSQNGNTIQPLSFLPSKKSKTYHGRYEKYTIIKNTWHFWVQHSTRSVYLKRTTLVRLLLNEGTFHKDDFHFDKRIHFIVNTKSKNTKKQQCVHLGVRDTPPLQIYFFWENSNFLVDIKINHSWFRKNRTKIIRLSQMFESEQITIKCRC